jgi:hypothetical protein
MPIIGLAVTAIIASLLSIRNANKNIELQNASSNIEKAENDNPETAIKMLEADKV